MVSPKTTPNSICFLFVSSGQKPIFLILSVISLHFLSLSPLAMKPYSLYHVPTGGMSKHVMFMKKLRQTWIGSFFILPKRICSFQGSGGITASDRKVDWYVQKICASIAHKNERKNNINIPRDIESCTVVCSQVSAREGKLWVRSLKLTLLFQTKSFPD